LREYLSKIPDQVLPKSKAGQAVSYALKNWVALTRYLEDGDLSIDNNHTERSLRGIAVGRNNWTFPGSDRGGRTMAVLRSFLASCELANLDPFAWFKGCALPHRSAVHPAARRNCCRTAGPPPLAH
jgi:transposase